MKTIRIALFTAALAPLFFALFAGCSGPEFPVKVRNLPPAGWAEDSVLHFSFRPSGPGQRVDLLYQVRHLSDYPFQNIYLKYTLRGPRRDTLVQSCDNLFLFEPATGKPVGRRAGKLIWLDAYFLRNVTLRDTGTYTLDVQQYMRRKSLNGIESIGLKIRKPAP